jgi:peptidoglycan/xylan/chitin deacetylase (PgdA/CDA1 family)
VAFVHLGPAATAIAPLRRRALPRLSGINGSDHIALTYDDGPDPASTPAFLRLLAAHDVLATFFLLGRFVAENPILVQEMSVAGHELAVHGWDHRCLAWKRPGTLTTELCRTRDLIRDLAGQQVRWYRPPYGVLTAEGMIAARRAGLQTVLWSSWGRDWRSRATPKSIVRTVVRPLRPGGTVLLHDTDRTSAPGSWRRTLAASDELLRRWSAEGVPTGTLTDHTN